MSRDAMQIKYNSHYIVYACARARMSKQGERQTAGTGNVRKWDKQLTLCVAANKESASLVCRARNV